MSAPRIGVLALQGDVREHVAVLAQLGVDATRVRRVSELDSCDALVIPGGESTTMQRLAQAYGLFEPIRERIGQGMPVFGTCAGLIMLADRVLDGTADQQTFGGLDITARRNAFGGQLESFETELDFVGIDRPVRAVFIRGPVIEEYGASVEVLASLPDGRAVAVRQGGLLAISFHPEVIGESAIHSLFLELVAGR